MPPDALPLFKEAAAVATVSRRAGAALARATVERVLKTLDPDAPKGANLEKRIDRIRSKVPATLGQLLDVVRVTANGALHADDQPTETVVIVLDDEVGPAAVELLLEAANYLVAELVTTPRAVQELWDKLPEGVREKAKKASPSGDAGAS
jgi:hypothetical protein